MCKMYIAPNIENAYNVREGGDTMPVSKAQLKATAKYCRENYDEIKIRMPKGYKERIKDQAKKTNESVNAYINRLIDEDIAQNA